MASGRWADMAPTLAQRKKNNNSVFDGHQLESSVANTMPGTRIGNSDVAMDMAVVAVDIVKPRVFETEVDSLDLTRTSQEILLAIAQTFARWNAALERQYPFGESFDANRIKAF